MAEKGVGTSTSPIGCVKRSYTSVSFFPVFREKYSGTEIANLSDVRSWGTPKMNFRHSKSLIAVALLAGTAALATPATATPVSNGYIVATFSDPTLQGLVANYPPGQNSLFSNSSTAVYNTSTTSVSSGQATATVSWGTNPDGASQSGGNFSSLTFASATSPIFGPSSSTPTFLGVLKFINGTSALDSLIFGVKLNLFYTTDGTNLTLLGTDNVIITTTSNQFSTTGLTDAQLQTDADYINICGNSSNICGTSIEAYESTEVASYFPSLFELDGTYDVDPMITITSASLILGDGAIGDLPPIATPEPLTLSLFGAGLAGAAALRRRKAKKA
jgi:hypothetical protein